MMIQEIRLLLVLSAMLTLPGWAMLAVSGLWRHWTTLQRWILAVSLSIAFYPLLFYFLRFVTPSFTLGPYKTGALLLVFAAVTAWRMRTHWKEQLAFERTEWIAIGVFGATLFTRLWIIQAEPYPAWSDSLHHTLLTQLTAQQGALPTDMQPYFPIPLAQYHLGLYALSASVQWLAQVPAHTALFWTAQVLNGLCVMGVYLVLDRKSGRTGAIAGAAVVGLLSHQPAFYVNWGRFTQVASQSILLVAWLVTWEAISLWQRPGQEQRVRILWTTALASVLVAAVFLLHFRVAAFLLPLLAFSVLLELWRARGQRRVGYVLLGTLAIGALSLLFVLPALWEAATGYTAAVTNRPTLSEEERAQTMDTYYHYAWSASYLVAHTWLLILAGASAIIGLLRRNLLVILCLLWTIALVLLGNAAALGIPLLSITNLGAVLIMLYLPIGLTVGAATEELSNLLKPRMQPSQVRLLAVAALLIAFLASHARVYDLEPYRFFVTPEDLKAMDWIEQNTPPDATFAVNTYFWLPRAPHGTDAGYWIPYLTGRQMTAGVMLLNLGTSEYQSSVVDTSRLVEQLETEPAALEGLYERGVDFVYVGERGDVDGPGLNPALLAQSDRAELVYRDSGVYLFRILAP
jgi:lipid-A-disaccharide synthase-like uncharacterized protein